MYKEKVINNIKKVMAEKGETNTSLAAKIRTSQSVISQILSNKYTLTIDRVEEIANALGVPPEKLFTEGKTTNQITDEERVIINNYRLIRECMHKYINSR